MQDGHVNDPNEGGHLFNTYVLWQDFHTQYQPLPHTHTHTHTHINAYFHSRTYIHIHSHTCTFIHIHGWIVSIPMNMDQRLANL
jgi:hypothetical protein